MKLRFVLPAVFAATGVIHLNCLRLECRKDPRIETSEIQFYLKSDATGNDILTWVGQPTAVPDSITLRDIETNQLFSLFIGLGSYQQSLVYSKDYRRPANIVDSLEFKFGNAPLDTIVVHTGIIDGWRGDECPTVKEPGITKVTLRNQVLIESNGLSLPTFTLKK